MAVSSLDRSLTGKFTVSAQAVSKVSKPAMFFTKICLLVSCELTHPGLNKIKDLSSQISVTFKFELNELHFVVDKS